MVDVRDNGDVAELHREGSLSVVSFGPGDTLAGLERPEEPSMPRK
jgi:hypothetical protein